ncbi:MAG: protein kinase [Candidatus Krumholzibacteriota bacterium]|nr:protein kinase [Candidatus Krumholzibacteriota bacterium]
MDKEIIGGFKIKSIIGRGGMGTVYLARDETLDRDLAIKILNSTDLGPEGKKRFLHEARACSKINHPNIVTVYSAGEEDGELYMAMELLEGSTLKDIIETGPLPWKQAASWTIDLLSAMKKLHDAGVIHRDLKPENIIVSPDKKLKLMDFGIARLASSETISIDGSTMGTVFYMSPEQASGSATDCKSDIFSLGVVLYQMLTGVLPFPGEHPVAVMYNIRSEQPIEIDRSSINIPDRLVEILDKAMAKEPGERYEDSADFSEALSTLLEKESAGLRLSPEAGRKRSIPRFMLPVIFVMILGLSISYYSLRQNSPSGNRQLALSLNEKAQQFERDNDLSGAKIAYRDAIIADQQWEVPWNNLGALALQAGDLDEADSLFRKAAALNPEYAPTFYNLATISWDRGDSEEAARFFNRSIRIDSLFYGAYNNLGALYIEKAKIEEAGNILDTGLAMWKKHPSRLLDLRAYMLKNRGIVAMKTGESGAEDYWKDALSILPENIEVHRLLALWYENRGEIDKALYHWRSVSDSDRSEERTEAIKALERLSPDRP